MTSLIRAIHSKAVKTPVPFTNKNIYLHAMPPRGQYAEMNAMGTVGTLFAIVHRLANATSQVEWKLYRKSKTGNKDDRLEVTSHLALETWNKPNAFNTQQEFIEIFQQHLELVGEAWWVINYNPDFPSIPLDMWTVRPDRMRPIEDPIEFISAYEYISPNGDVIRLEKNEVIFLRLPNPLDPYRGMGPVQSLLTDLDAVKYSAEYNRNFFLNDATPGGVIELDETLSDPEFAQFSKRWNEGHKGVNNAHRVAILERGKFIDRKYTMRDMQFTELRNVSRDVIFEGFGISKAMLGIVDDVNRATMEAIDAMFGKRHVVPRLERIKQALNNDYLPLFGVTGQGLEFDYDYDLVVPDDTELGGKVLNYKTQSATDLVNMGFDKEDVLKVLGLPAIKVAATPAPTNPASSLPVSTGGN